MDLHYLISVFFGFFAIMNPIANTAVFIGLVGAMPAKKQKQTALKALLLTFGIILCFSLLGKAIFHLFGISLLAMRLTGGILIFIVGYQMLHGESSKLHTHNSGDEEGDLSITPLAVPILAGPGTIATAMNFSADGGWTNILICIAGFALLCLITYIAFINGQRIIRLLGQSGLTVVTRLMGLILAVIGMQMLIEASIELSKLWLPA